MVNDEQHRWLVIVMGVVALSLSACEMTGPSYISNSPITVTYDHNSHVMPTAGFTAETAKILADDYAARGEGPVEVIVTYLAGHSAQPAENDARRIAGLLRARGLEKLSVDTLPINDTEQSGLAMVKYVQVSAQPPAGCEAHPSEDRSRISGNTDGWYEGYRFGCGVDSYIAQQVARPKDLVGTTDMAPAGGDRFGGILKDYRDGKDYKDLKAKNASEVKL